MLFTALPPARAAMLKKLMPPTGVAAEFEDASLRVGTMQLQDARMICLFNWEDAKQSGTFRVPAPATITDYWTGQSLGRREGLVSLDLAPRSARLLKVAL
jgi:alpha-galactosidase